MPFGSPQLPWYIVVFQWAQLLSTVIFPLVAIAAVVILFFIWRELRRIADASAPIAGQTIATTEETTVSQEPVRRTETDARAERSDEIFE